MERYRKGSDYPHLFTPIRIGNVRLKNRIIAAPTSPQMLNTEGHLTDELIAYYVEKAKGGAAVVTLGESIVHSPTGKSHNKQIQLDSFGIRQGLTKCAREIHNAGAYANIQLAHGGKYAGLASVGGFADLESVAYGPSEEDTPQGHVYEMPKETIYTIIKAYADAAKLCKTCGFDMVQVHAAHGWLFSQFLSPVQNRRTDEFGGSLENRARFLLMTLDAVREAVGPAFPIEIRLSGDDMVPWGMGPDECVEVAKLVDPKVDLFNISCGDHEEPSLFQRTHPSAFFPRGVNVYLAAKMKGIVTKPVACVGSLEDPAQMEEIIATGQSDIVELGRILVADPFMPNKALNGKADDITPCLRCYECFGDTVDCEYIKCSVNPTMGFQTQDALPVPEPEYKKKVLIVGGGPAGMEAAITAAKRGHDVTLAEKDDRLGGNLHPAGAAFFKQDIADFCKVMERRVAASDVKVLLNTEVTPEFVKEFAPDALMVCIGSTELRPRIPGLDGDNVIMAIDAELHPEKVGHKVAMLGGGLVGAEGAVSLNHEGHEVTVIEMKPDIAGEVTSFYRGGLMAHVEKAAELMVNTRVTEVTPDGVKCVRDGEELFVPADSVICAMGFRSPYDKVDALCEGLDEVYVLGDCAKVAKIGDALRDAHYAAMRM